MSVFHCCVASWCQAEATLESVVPLVIIGAVIVILLVTMVALVIFRRYKQDRNYAALHNFSPAAVAKAVEQSHQQTAENEMLIFSPFISHYITNKYYSTFRLIETRILDTVVFGTKCNFRII